MKHQGGKRARVSFAARLSQLRQRSKAGGANGQLSVQLKRTVFAVKVCLQKRRSKGEVLKAIDVVLSARQNRERQDLGASLLAEYVACRSGLSVRSPQYLGKSNPLWLVSEKRGSKRRPLCFSDCLRMSYLHSVTKLAVRGVVAEDALLTHAKKFLETGVARAWPQWVLLAAVCTAFATRCLPWLHHASAFVSQSAKAVVDVFNLVCSFRNEEHLSPTPLEFTDVAFVPRTRLANGKVLRPTRDVMKVTRNTVLGWFAAFRDANHVVPLSRGDVRELCRNIFTGSWKLNLSHFLRWLTLCGLCAEESDSQGAGAGALTSSTNATLFLQLCRVWGWPHTYASLHASFLGCLAALGVDPGDRRKLARLAAAVCPDDTPGNMCKVVCVCEALLFGGSINESAHELVVSPSPAQVALQKELAFRCT